MQKHWEWESRRESDRHRSVIWRARESDYEFVLKSNDDVGGQLFAILPKSCDSGPRGLSKNYGNWIREHKPEHELVRRGCVTPAPKTISVQHVCEDHEEDTDQFFSPFNSIRDGNHTFEPPGIPAPT